MTIANIARKSGPFVADGSTTVFPYNFRIFTAGELAVYRDASLVNSAEFSVNGVNSPSGSIVFNIAPATGVVVWIFGDTDKEQPTDYIENDPFPANSHETGLDRGIMVDWELDEALERTLKFHPSALPAVRNLELPPPQPLLLFSWDANGEQVVYVPSTILTVTPVPGGGAVVTAQATQTVPAINDVIQLTTSGLVPAGARLTDGMAFLDVAWSQENGITAWSLGTASASGRYGQNLAISQGTATNAGIVINYVQEPAPSGLELLLTATAGGNFGLTGTASVTAQYVLYVPPQAAP